MQLLRVERLVVSRNLFLFIYENISIAIGSKILSENDDTEQPAEMNHRNRKNAEVH